MHGSGGARRRLGQNFLIDRDAVRRIVELLDLRVGEAVFEIGPGRGALTGALIEAAGRVVPRCPRASLSFLLAEQLVVQIEQVTEQFRATLPPDDPAPKNANIIAGQVGHRCRDQNARTVGARLPEHRPEPPRHPRAGAGMMSGDADDIRL